MRRAEIGAARLGGFAIAVWIGCGAVGAAEEKLEVRRPRAGLPGPGAIVRDSVARSSMTSDRDIPDFTRLLHGTPAPLAERAAPSPREPDLALGVSQSLARWRAVRVAVDTIDVEVALDLEVGVARIRSTTRVRRLDRAAPLVFDWRPDAGATGAIDAWVDGVPLPALPVRDGHVVIDAARLGAREVVTVVFDTVAPLRDGGGPITRFRDAADPGAEYVWSLFVPADASRVFPCMDQPDLKARFGLTLDAPGDWRVIGNATVEQVDALDGRQRRHRFARTPPLSTYLFAFAAGPFVTLPASRGEPAISGTPDPGVPVALHVRRVRADDAQRALDAITRPVERSMHAFATRFGQPFAWGKHDLVALPDFPYGGMEHAGATFLRESALLLPAEATAVERLRRTQLLVHETAHQWFGDLVTMRGFDDLWLKEGFANRLAFEVGDLDPPTLPLLAEVTRRADAMRADLTPGTVPVYRPLDNVLGAKAMYGPIVYQKAPWVLDQWMEAAANPEQALLRFVRDHAFGVADRDDLIAAFGASGAGDASPPSAPRPGFDAWMRTWITQLGVITVEPDWAVAADGSIGGTLHFEAPARTGPWAMPPRLVIQVLWHNARRALRVDLRDVEVIGPGRWRLPWRLDVSRGQDASTDGDVIGVLPYEGAREWLRWRMDAKTAANAVRAMGFDRAADRLHLRAWEALSDRLHDTRIAPTAWLEQVIPLVPEPRGAWVTAQHAARVERVLRAALPPPQRDAWAGRVENAWLARIEAPAREVPNRPGLPLSSPVPRPLPATFERITAVDARDARREAWRAYVAIASTPDALARLDGWLDDRALPDGIVPTVRERFAIVRTLLRQQAPGAADVLARLRAAHTDRDAQRWAYAAAAATPDGALKAALLDAWIADASIPDAWIEEALPAWAAPEHADLRRQPLARSDRRRAGHGDCARHRARVRGTSGPAAVAARQGARASGHAGAGGAVARGIADGSVKAVARGERAAGL
ncbi:MAG: hypothetical protein MUF30_10865 [Burkholderiales bacterium]|nr:hypothetical protein [Burkholderiales bacterium]